MTKTEADPEIKDYAAMDNDIVDGLYNKKSLLDQVLMTQESMSPSPTLS